MNFLTSGMTIRLSRILRHVVGSVGKVSWKGVSTKEMLRSENGSVSALLPGVLNSSINDMKSTCTKDYVTILTLVWKMLSGSSIACTTGGAASTVKSITSVSATWFTVDFEELKRLGTNPGSLISSKIFAWNIGVMGSANNPLEITHNLVFEVHFNTIFLISFSISTGFPTKFCTLFFISLLKLNVVVYTVWCPS